MTRYEKFTQVALHALAIEEGRTGEGKFPKGAVTVLNEEKVAVYINLSSDPMEDEVQQYVDHLYHNGPIPRWLADSSQ